MPKPTASQRPKILFFCRGRGRGHAIPDIEIARELRSLQPDIDLVFASYSTGGVTLAQAGLPVIDMNLPESVRFLEFMVRATHVMLRERPDIIVSHEEFAALPAAKSLGLPATFIVDFFAPAEWMVDSLGYADEILFIERRGIFTEPAPAQGRVRYVGPVVRPMSATRSDRARARAQLDLPESAPVIAVIPGAWANEERAPLHDLLVPAFDRLAHPGKKLLWIAGEDRESLTRRLGPRSDVILLPELSPIENLMVASDVVITKANRGSTIDLASLGIPSVSLSWGLNPIDEMIISRIHNNIALNARGIDPAFLAETLTRALSERHQAAACPSPDYRPGGGAAAARELARIIQGAIPPP